MVKLGCEQIRKSMRLYAVTDSSFLQGRTLPDCVAAALSGGVSCVQLREKHMPGPELEKLALSLQALCKLAQVLFLINDEVECALAVGADGVHIGQSDMSCKAARKLLGSDKVIGVSVRTLEEALAAQAASADYLGVGALFGTPTKPEAAEVDKEILRDICAAVSIPVVAIGGLNERTIPELAGTGADGVAVVSALFATNDIEEAVKRLKACVDKSLPLL